MKILLAALLAASAVAVTAPPRPPSPMGGIAIIGIITTGITPIIAITIGIAIIDDEMRPRRAPPIA